MDASFKMEEPAWNWKSTNQDFVPQPDVAQYNFDTGLVPVARTGQIPFAALANRQAANAERKAALQKKIEALEWDIERRAAVIGQGPADRVLIEKKKRQLTLIAKGKALKTYRIALGGNPDGPKERQGDNKTPEGTYVIEGRNRGSRYHLSLRISYPNEKDKKRAKAMGVAPGGDIMIHGIKNGFSWVGNLHTGLDWTKGCIAVTDEEIEEIEKLVPDGTTVEIRP